MKQIKLFSVVLLLATMFLSFNACSDDDDDNPDNGNKSKKITKIVNEYDEDMIRTEIFTHSNDKMMKYTTFYGGEDGYTENNQTITYSGNTVIMDGLLDKDDCIQTYTLNKDGLAISCKYVDKDNAEDEDEYTFQYSDGYLIGMSCKYEVYTFQYSNGNMIKAIGKDVGYNESTTYTLTYSDNENKGILNPFFEDLFFSHKPALYMGILGKHTKNLAVSCTESDEWGTDNSTCVYSLDNDNYVKTAIFSNGDKLTYTFE